MILRRISEGIRQQDWFVVIVEVMIVVVGIFLGLQMDEWNEQRQDREREQTAISRLAEESVDITHYFIETLERRTRTLELIEEGVIAAYQVISGDAYSEDALADLVRATRYSAISPPRIVFDELSASGDIMIIQNPDIRHAIAAYYRRLEFVQNQIPAFRSGGLSEQDRMNAGLIPFYDPNSRVRRSFRFDEGRLRSNPDAVAHFAESLRDKIVFSSYIASALREAHEMCVQLAKSDNTTCPDIDQVLVKYRAAFAVPEVE